MACRFWFIHTPVTLVISTLIKHGELKQADRRLNIRAYYDRQTGKWYACMNEQPYHLWFSLATTTCNPIFKAEMPQGWEDPLRNRYTVNEHGQLVGIDGNVTGQ